MKKRLKKGIICFILVMIMLLTAMPAFADDTSYHYYYGTCYKHFTTSGYISRSGNQVPSAIRVHIGQLTFSGTPSYSYAMIKIVDQAGYQCDAAEAVYAGNNNPGGLSYREYSDITPRSSTTQFKLKVFHPYAYDEGTSASSSMTIVQNTGSYFKAIW